MKWKVLYKRNLEENEERRQRNDQIENHTAINLYIVYAMQSLNIIRVNIATLLAK